MGGWLKLFCTVLEQITRVWDQVVPESSTDRVNRCAEIRIPFLFRTQNKNSKYEHLSIISQTLKKLVICVIMLL